MKKQGNIFQIKEQKKREEIDSSETEISKLPDRESKMISEMKDQRVSNMWFLTNPGAK